MVMPMSVSKDKSMFPPYDFNLSSYLEGCFESNGVWPRPRWITTEFGGLVSWNLIPYLFSRLMLRVELSDKACQGDASFSFFLVKDLRTALKTFGSNIIFSNGLLDPWSGGGWVNFFLIIIASYISYQFLFIEDNLIILLNGFLLQCLAECIWNHHCSCYGFR